MHVERRIQVILWRILQQTWYILHCTLMITHLNFNDLSAEDNTHCLLLGFVVISSTVTTEDVQTENWPRHLKCLYAYVCRLNALLSR